MVRVREPQAFTAEACSRVLGALVRAAEGATGGDPLLAVDALLRCEGPWPADAGRSAGKLVRTLIAHGRLQDPYALLALAGMAGSLTRAFVTRVFRWQLSALARDEVGVLTRLGAPAQLLVAKVCRDGAGDPPEAWRRLAAMPPYAAFAGQALERAHERVAAIHSGARPYEPDRAFARDEVKVIGRAARVALLRDEPWLAKLLEPLLLGVAVAPTAARTLPSQALLYELARAVEDFPTPEALAALNATRGALRHRGVPRQLDRMLKRIERALAARPDMAFRLPDLGFGPDGTRTETVGHHQAVIALDGEIALRWRRANGSWSATVPAAVRRDHPAELKALRDLVKQVRGQVLTVGRTLEAGLSVAAAQPYGRWRDELAGNGLGWSLARRLIWEVELQDGRWRAVLPGDDGALRDATGATVAVERPDAEIRLWHPLRARVEEIRAWRDLLTDRQLRQPFKQAFREIYLLTPAELSTRTYSNRFAAHVLRYRQLYALLKGRGWSASMLGPWDGGDAGEAYGRFAGGTWRAAFVHGYLDRQPDDTECAGTDRVWFERADGGAWRLAALDEVPAIVFSEAMRDVDLFVSVTSIAGDPNWADRGDEPHAAYWRRASLGELTATAQVRRAALERILPGLAIAGRCTLTDRYLAVNGDLRSYRIHLGSANILMSPDDAYLCIVPATPRPGERVFLPFEDDRLALILSKAFLLADDTRITDPSILAQLHRPR
jgi:hypothetical protein